MPDVNYQLFAESVAEECVFGVKHPDLALAEQTLAQLGLSSLRDRHPGALSGGQKQRLAAAAAIVGGKELLVFDEPTSGLDYDSMARLAAQIRRLAEAGRVIFIVTHDYEFICRTCSRALHLDGGKLRNDLPVTAENLSAVSYTHLDVYKRQAIDCEKSRDKFHFRRGSVLLCRDDLKHVFLHVCIGLRLQRRVLRQRLIQGDGGQNRLGKGLFLTFRFTCFAFYQCLERFRLLFKKRLSFVFS